MKIPFCLFLAAAAGLSGCATTDSTSTTTQAVPAAQTADTTATEVVDSPARMASATGSKNADSDDDLVCKDIARIGTRFTQRICKSKAQIAEEREAGKSMLDPSRTLAVPGNPPPQPQTSGPSH